MSTDKSNSVTPIQSDTLEVSSLGSSAGGPGERTRAIAGMATGYDAQAALLVPVQRKSKGSDTDNVHEAAAKGIAGGGGALPHAEQIQRSFGGYDISNVTAHTDSAAATASAEMGADAYAAGSHVAFSGAPDLHTAAHETAHVVQQKAGVQLSGGVGKAGDGYEVQADKVADAVVAGKDASPIFGETSGGPEVDQTTMSQSPSTQQLVQRVETEGEGGSTPPTPAATVPRALAATDLVLSRVATEANTTGVGRYAANVDPKITPWGHAFDRGSVGLATDSAAAQTVIALGWSTAWGPQPITIDQPANMSPIDAKACVGGVHKLAGWSTVSSADQSVLNALLGGETNLVGVTARDHLGTSFGPLSGQTPIQQATALSALIGAGDTLPAMSDEAVATTPVTFTVSAATTVPSHAFHGRTAAAESYTVTFSDGAAISVFAPAAPTPGMHQHTVDQAAEAAAYLPTASRAVLTQIVLNVIENPDDPHWAVEYNTPNFHSYMTAGVDGVVTIYPNRTAAQPGDNYRRGTAIHETGHTWSYQKWGTDTTAGGWVAWQTAMTADRTAISGYANADIAEDVAETITAYGSTKGTPKYDEYKTLIPHRWAILEAEMQ